MDNTCQFLIEMLKLLEGKVPPPARYHHTIMYTQYGSGYDWEDRLALAVNCGGVIHIIFIEDGDFMKNPTELVADIIQVLAEVGVRV